MIDIQSHREKFVRLYNCEPEHFASAPGRVNLIGEHTDYNGGFVLPAAIERNVLLAVAPASGPHGRLFSVQHDEFFEVTGAAPKPGSWPSYFLAVAELFFEQGHNLPALDVLIDGDVPLGAGLSSSAAYEVATAVLYNQLLDAGLNRTELALLAQAAENGPMVGMRCGIMDQFISANGEEGKAIRLDCYSLEYRAAQMAGGAPTILIIDSKKKRGLVDSAYNERRRQCEEALEIIRNKTGRDIPTLRHVTFQEFEQHASALTIEQQNRVRHNLTENRRVDEFCEAIEHGAWDLAGELLYASHASLRDDYEVSCAEIDTIVELSHQVDGIYGCRVTGAGFGGCCVALARPEAIEPMAQKLAEEYEPKFNLSPVLLPTNAAPGATVWSARTELAFS